MRRTLLCLPVLILVVVLLTIVIRPSQAETELAPRADYTTIAYTPTIIDNNSSVNPVATPPPATPTVLLQTLEAEATMATESSVEKESLGIFTITAYCSCPKCCGKWSGMKMNIPTEDGVPYPQEGYTVSVDPKIIPLKSTIDIEGYGVRYAHDTGSAIRGKRIDMYFTSHDDALSFGKRKLEVFKVT